MTRLDDLYAIEDPRRLFLKATEAINQHQEDVDEIAAIRAGAIAALYAQGYSYKELAETLGMSAPRVGQLVTASGEAAIKVLRSWFVIERRLEEVARIAKPSMDSRSQPRIYSAAINALVESGRIEPQIICDLDSIREIRNHLVHGRAQIATETAEDILDTAVHLNAMLTIWINDERAKLGATATQKSAGLTPRSRSLSSVDQAHQKLARLAKDESTLRKRLSDANAAAAKARATASTKRQQAARTSSGSMARSYLSSAESADKKAASEDNKAADASKKLSDLARRRASAVKELESADRASERSRSAAEGRRRTEERRHAQEVVARLASPTVRYVHEVRTVEPPKPEKLRVLYLTSNPDSNAYLRVDVEVRDVRQAIRKATHRDLVEMDHRPAATPEDLLDGMNEQRPHVIHFAGHGGGYSLLFDDAADNPSGRSVSFDILARALTATDAPPNVLVLNACDTLEGAEVLLDSVPVIIAMAAEISDLAASAFAARFYSAIASAQSVQSAANQGAVAVDLLELSDGWKPALLCRDDIDAGSLILVHVPEAIESGDGIT